MCTESSLTFPQALKAFKQCVTIDPQYKEAWNFIGQVHEKFPSLCHPIGLTWSIFPLSAIPLASLGAYSLSLPSHWPLTESIPSF
jgi:hypothetical protein